MVAHIERQSIKSAIPQCLREIFHDAGVEVAAVTMNHHQAGLLPVRLRFAQRSGQLDTVDGSQLHQLDPDTFGSLGSTT